MRDNNTLLGRCCAAYGETIGDGWSPVLQIGVAAVLEHLAAELMAYQELRGSVTSHELARILLEAARPATGAVREVVHG